MLPTREGLFNAYPVEIGIDETGPNQLATCIIRFALYEELQPSGEWADCAGENWQITGYFYLEKKDGSLNTLTIDALKAALGWDGRDPFWLQETDLSDHPVQVKLGVEQFGGRSRIKVRYLNPVGTHANGGVSKADEAKRRTIRNRLGSKLRAISGPPQPGRANVVANDSVKLARPTRPASPPNRSATPVTAAATSRAVETSVTPASKRPSRLRPASPSEPGNPSGEPDASPGPSADTEEATMEQAWQAFCEAYAPLGDRGSNEDRERQWFRVIAELFPGKQPDELTPAEWATMRQQGPTRIIPF